MYLRTIPFDTSFDNYGVIYKVDDTFVSSINKYCICEVPMRNKNIPALVVEIFDNADDTNLGKVTYQLKKITGVISSESYFTDESLKVVEFLSQKYAVPIHKCLKLFFHKHLINEIQKYTYQKRKITPVNYKNNLKVLTKIQQEALDNLINTQYKVSLLYGVTGSGKTLIYTHLVQHMLSQGRQSLVLVPEIFLSSQVLEFFKKTFGDDVLYYHSGITNVAKTKIRKEIKTGNSKIIIGTRSAFFLPYADLGIVIMDEEHDQSYESDQSPKYNLKDVLINHTKDSNTKLVLGSGTPSINSMYRALQGEYNLVQITDTYKKD